MAANSFAAQSTPELRSQAIEIAAGGRYAPVVRLRGQEAFCPRRRTASRRLSCREFILWARTEKYARIRAYFLVLGGTSIGAAGSEWAMRFPFLSTCAILSLGAFAPHSLSPQALAAPAKTPAKPAKTVAPALPSLAGWNFTLDDDELEKSWTWTSRLQAAGDGESRIVFDWRNDKNYLMLRVLKTRDGATMRFWRVIDGVIEKLGDPDAALPSGEGKLTLQRSAWRARVLWNGRALVTATAQNPGDDLRFGVASRGKIEFASRRMQPTEAVTFRDDFMRASGPDDAEVAGLWHRAAGIWKTSGLLGPRADAALNPNPFVYRSENPKGRAEATVGQWFWTDYTVETSIRPALKNLSGALVAGVAAYRQEDGSAVSGEVDFRKGVARIKSDGKVLATSAPFAVETDQWHRVFLDPGPGTIRLVVDGVERARAENTNSSPLAQGHATLQSDLGGGNWADFDDVRVAPNDATSDDFSLPSVGRWTDLVGEWQTRRANQANKTLARRVKMTNGAGLSLTGADTREEGRLEATFVAPKKSDSPFAVAFAARDAGHYFLAKVRPNSVQIVEMNGGAEKVLGTKKGATGANVSVEWRDGIISATSGKTTATASPGAIPAGRVGVWADGAMGAQSVTSFRALGAAPVWGEGALPERFTKDVLMKNWASNALLWQSAPADKSGTRWHVGDFFSDATLSLVAPTLSAEQKLVLLLGASPTSPESGAKLTLERVGLEMTFELSEGGKVVKRETVSIKDARGALRFARRPIGDGRVALRVVLPNRAVFAETVTGSAANTKVGVRIEGGDLDWEKATAQTGNVVDYSFTGAPVDWRAGKGVWDVKERWTCSPQWGFFAGLQSVNPTLWSRFATKGDFTLEAYLATPMDTTRGERSPADLNFSVGGDGRDLSSGYSFLFSANGRQSNRLYRGDALVGDQPFVRPKIAGSDHQDWFYVRLERRETKEGLRFHLTVNGQETWNYLDKNPLKSGGHLAFWTYNGGLSIARVRLWHSGLDAGKDDAAAPLLASDSKPAPAPTNALGEWQTRRENLLQTAARVRPIKEPKSALEIVNAQSGGDWTVYASRTAFEATAHPTLSFRYRLPANVLVNLYARVDGRWREISFSGDSVSLPRRALDPALTPAGQAPSQNNTGTTVPSIGKIENVLADDKWHSATFDLLGALQKAGLPTKVEALSFAAPDRDYLRAGLGANHLGAKYWISDFDAPLAGTKVAAR